MAGKKILIIGSVSKEEIHLTQKATVFGEVAYASTRHEELGGRAGNTAISAYRASRPKPAELGGTSGYYSNDNNVDIHIIAGVADKENEARFKARLQVNGVIADGLEILPLLETEPPGPIIQDYSVSMMAGDTGKTDQTVNFRTSNQWPVEHFDDVRKICGDLVPDLVVVTMELKKNVIQKIIETFAGAGIDVLLFASPGEPLTFDDYSRLTHLVLNEADAAIMLGYTLDKVKSKIWPDICEAFIQRGVKNVVLKVGALGAYFKNADDEGYSSGYTQISDIVDQTGATNAFVGPYAVQYVRDKSAWNLRDATERGNKASGIFGIDLGAESAIPWSDDVEKAPLVPLYTSIADLQKGKKKPLEVRKYGMSRAPVEAPDN